MTKAVYAGSFDPFTLGHQYIYEQASAIFDEVIILLAINPKKSRFTNMEEMKDAIQHMTRDSNVYTCEGLVANFCKTHNVKYLVRGLRNTSDYLYEEEVAKVNMEIYPELQTVYLRAKDDVVSSTLVRLLFEQGRSISKYIPKEILPVLKGGI